MVACFDRVGCLGEYTGLYALWLPLSQAEQEQVDPSQIGITSFPSITD
ncbi:MAG: hypothetical protein Q8O99_07535 [bacterium]|nr:hypothetical protein [bacterium]